MEKEPTIEELKNFLGEYLELKGINTSSVFRCFSPCLLYTSDAADD